MKNKLSLAYSIYGIITFASLGITVAMYLISVNALKETIAARELSRAEKSYNVVDAVVDQNVRLLSATAWSLGQNRLLLAAMARFRRDGDFSALHRAADRIYPKLNVDLFQLSGPDQRVLYRAHTPQHYGDIPNIWGVAEALQGREVVTTVPGPDGWGLRAVVPAVADDGAILGTIMIGYRLNDRFAARIDLGANTLVIGTLEGVIARSRPKKSYPPKQCRINETLMFMSIKQGKVFNETFPEQHFNRYYKRLKIADTTFGLVVEVDTTESYRDFVRTQYELAGSSAAIFLTALLLGAAFCRRLLRPLRYLQQQTSATISGITGENHSSEQGNELDALVDSFNVMRDMLLKRIVRIEEADAELQEHKTRLEALVERLELKNTRLSGEIAERQKAERELKDLHNELMEASRRVGMAQVATDVLHNVGNVLNSVNVAAIFIKEKLQDSKIANLNKAVAMMCEHLDDIGNYLSADEKGSHIPVYLREGAGRVAEDHQAIYEKLNQMIRNIDHIKDIVKMQQAYAQVSGVKVTVPLREVIDDAIQISSASLKHHDIAISRVPDRVGTVEIDKQRVMQILVNLIDNAKDALVADEKSDRTITIATEIVEGRIIRIGVTDNGIGLDPETLAMIFEHGFTTKEGGHGFGLHGSVIAAREMNGSLRAASDGPGHGCTFTLEIPYITGR